jgi:hypothetical protein
VPVAQGISRHPAPLSFDVRQNIRQELQSVLDCISHRENVPTKLGQNALKDDIEIGREVPPPLAEEKSERRIGDIIVKCFSR